MLRALASSTLLVTTVLAQSNFPPPPAPSNNPHTPEKELLGMALFFEEQLSSTGTVACATCHDFQSGGVDARTAHSLNPGVDGVFGTADDQHGSPGIALVGPTGQAIAHPTAGFGAQITRRRAPTVINSGYHTHLMYDGGKASLEDVIAVPPINPIEMGHSGRTWTHVEQKIAGATPLLFASNLPQRLQNFLAGHDYPELFQITFGTPAVTQQRIVDSIATYVRTLNSDQSKWDLVQHGQAQLTAEEQLGLTLFETPANGATSCHTCHGDFEDAVLTEGPIAGQMTMVSTGYYGAPVATRLVFHNIGIRPPAEDPGRQVVTTVAADTGKFRVASLRNVALTAPYFHNGSASNLRTVLDFYNRGGDFHSNQAANLTPRNYSVSDKEAIIALLETLTDPRVAAGVQPFDRPTLGSQNGAFVTSHGAGSVTQSGQMVANAPYAPLLGESSFQLTLSGVTPGTPTFLLWDTALGAGNAPFGIDLGLTSSFQAFLVGVGEWSWTLPGTGIKVVPLPLPNQPSLSGAVLYAEWLALEPSQSSQWATSDALRIELQ